MVGQGVREKWRTKFDLASCENIDHIEEMWKKVLSSCTKEQWLSDPHENLILIKIFKDCSL